MPLTDLLTQLEQLADPADATHLARYFQTGPGGYGEGDRFRGLRVPVLRKLARSSRDLALADTLTLLHSPWHEDRLLALLIWVEQVRRGDAAIRQARFDAYLAHLDRINNWDLIDTSAGAILGAHLYATGQTADVPLLTDMARAPRLWDRRVAIMTTAYFIARGVYGETLRLADLLLRDDEDLIHKAVGWMLREVGNRDRAVEEAFLQPRYAAMPRTMLRYAIEKFPEARRQDYLHGRI